MVFPLASHSQCCWCRFRVSLRTALVNIVGGCCGTTPHHIRLAFNFRIRTVHIFLCNCIMYIAQIQKIQLGMSEIDGGLSTDVLTFAPGHFEALEPTQCCIGNHTMSHFLILFVSFHRAIVEAVEKLQSSETSFTSGSGQYAPLWWATKIVSNLYFNEQISPAFSYHLHGRVIIFSKFQRLFTNLQLVDSRNGIQSPKICSNTHG